MAESDRNEPINEQVVANMYTAMRSELNQIYSKITELEMDVSEHSLVINAIQPLDPSRRCYRMIGGVLVERTIKEVLPAVQRNKEGIEEVIVRLNEAAERKKKEIADFEAKYKIRIRKSDSEVKDDTNKKEGSSQGVLVGPADDMPNLYLISSEGYEQSVLTCEGEKVDGMMGESAFKRTILSFGTLDVLSGSWDPRMATGRLRRLLSACPPPHTWSCKLPFSMSNE
ncbi:hypothetical protein H0E87_015547 [Populus deltoides]|uniref:Prefoldin subunit 2 n=1 Tax=Populus deltoides TaxID=3696 RepID=A0A8T2Y5C0_POPDE|nr:hypothetical protein H0E87_015547 [Populus deltoides]